MLSYRVVKGTPATLRIIYRRLLRAFGPQGWWPARTSFEMMAGAVLTQATNWRNVERAIERLRRAGALRPQRLLALRRGELEDAIRPAGYFRQKAKRLQAFARWYAARYAGSARRMFRTPWPALRRELLGLHGIGPETADSILLYAGAQPVFVIDAYTIRVFARHRLLGRRAAYDAVQRLAMRALPADAALYNEFHALLVAVGKRYCHRRAPDCAQCPLGDLPHTIEVNAR
ncbi:MAG: endonuclease III domain-containing protein [Candidatus Omnitrophica bacterium]|nr:endonuclease III domain-containing protein [Candidatus Omnitrophota bacterium]